MAKASLTQGQAIGTSNTDLYQTATNLAKTKINKAQFVNSDGGGPIFIDVFITPDAATPTSERLKVIDSLEIGENETYLAVELIGEYVEKGGKIIAKATGSGVNAWINGETFKTGG